MFNTIIFGTSQASHVMQILYLERTLHLILKPSSQKLLTIHILPSISYHKIQFHSRTKFRELTSQINIFMFFHHI